MPGDSRQRESIAARLTKIGERRVSQAVRLERLHLGILESECMLIFRKPVALQMPRASVERKQPALYRAFLFFVAGFQRVEYRRHKGKHPLCSARLAVCDLQQSPAAI